MTQPRRTFLQQAAIAGAALTFSVGPKAQARAPRDGSAGFLDIRRDPDAVMVETAAHVAVLSRSRDEWRGTGMAVTTARAGAALSVRLSAPDARINRVQLRWRGDMRAMRIMLGDAWERAYGDLEWRGMAPDRVMPWYFAGYDGRATHAYGVRTAPGAFCSWRADDEGITLVADVRSGGSALALGARVLDVCTVICREGREGESAFAALHAFCRDMCAHPRTPPQAIFGSNDWYWAYGKNSAESIRSDALRIVELSPGGSNRPFAVIDDGWQPERADKAQVGRWDRANAKFGDIAAVAADVRGAGARPGIWIRPLLASSDAPDTWRLSRNPRILDPSVPDAAAKIAADIARLRGWGFDLIKHDYTTFDLSGRWGFQMGAALTEDGWTFAGGPSRTTAEVMADLYRGIRTAAGDALIIGCNTVGHLSAGVFDICRLGDDTSGTDWSRTRRMGVNTLAFRGVQHGAFYAADADCVGVSTAIPWKFNRQWLDLLARSGTTLFVSLAPDAVGADETRDLRAALATAAAHQPLGEPIDWERTIWPSAWRLGSREARYDWVGADGVSLQGATT
ncbi:MAG TPA: hypothetical protein VGL62_05290 [Vicinamibacterales bacterium]